jgi:signal transduction histidine kinase
MHNAGVTLRRLGWVLVIMGGLAMVATPVIGAWSGHLAEAARSAPQVVAYFLIGALTFVFRPGHRAARRLLALGALLAVANTAGTAYSAYVTAAGTPGWAWWAVLVLQGWDFAWFVQLFALFAVFPDGEYQRRYERRILVVLTAAVPVLLIMQLIGTARLETTAYVWQDKVWATNPVAVAVLAPVGAFASVAIQAGVLALVAGVVVLVLRYRRFGPLQRQQIAWPLYALALTGCFIAVLGALSSAMTTVPDWVRYVVFLPVVLPIPVSLVIGMLRHRLLDIDVVVHGSVVYGALWLLIASAYIGLAALFGVALGQRVPLDLAIVLTIVATVVAAPVRRRLERLADRLVFGRRLSGYELISQLGDRLKSSPAPEDVAGTVAAAVQTGLGARWVRVTLNRPQPHAVAAAGIDLAAPGEPVLHVPLVHGPDVVGAIECGAKSEGRYSQADQHLLETLGRQAALAIRNSQLTTELSDRLMELAASRARLVQAEEAGRRRLERDIHDGVQQELVAVLARLGLARNQLRRDTSLAASTLREAQADGRRALESLQELVRGIHPPILTDRGLLEAVRERAARLPIPTEVSSDGLAPHARFAPDIEGAAYFFVCEALGNVLKHAVAGHARVCFRSAEDGILVQVRDDGLGFDIESVARSGLRGLHDRIEALGGRVDVASTPRHGTTISAWLPTGARP